MMNITSKKEFLGFLKMINFEDRKLGTGKLARELSKQSSRFLHHNHKYICKCINNLDFFLFFYSFSDFIYIVLFYWLHLLICRVYFSCILFKCVLFHAYFISCFLMYIFFLLFDTTICTHFYFFFKDFALFYTYFLLVFAFHSVFESEKHFAFFPPHSVCFGSFKGVRLLAFVSLPLSLVFKVSVLNRLYK